MPRRSSFALLFVASSALTGCSIVVESELDSKMEAGDGGPDDGGCDADSSDACGCAPGFAPGPGGCVFAGFVSDPGFERESGSPWSAEGDATLNPTLGGFVEAGVARFDTFALCGGDRVEQQVTLPPLAELPVDVQDHGLVLELSYRGAASNNDTRPGPIVEMGAAGELRFPHADLDWKIERRCLGVAAYDLSMDLAVRGSEPRHCGGAEVYSLDVDRLAVVPAEPGECPPHGVIQNGNFESDESWDLVCRQPNGEPVSCEMEDGAGSGGSRAPRFTTTAGCSHAGARAWVSFPSAAEMPNLAVELWVSGTLVDPLRVMVDEAVHPESFSIDDQIGEVPVGAVDSQIIRFCVPDESLGRVERLAIFVSTGGGCFTENANDVRIDNVQLISDVGCDL